MKQTIIFTLTIIMTLSACNKENKFENAIIRDYGDPAVDGCGWVVDISSTIYTPRDLPTQFQVDKLEVKMKYDILDSKFKCGVFLQLSYDEIHIRNIKRE